MSSQHIPWDPKAIYPWTSILYSMNYQIQGLFYLKSKWILNDIKHSKWRPGDKKSFGQNLSHSMFNGSMDSLRYNWY